MISPANPITNKITSNIIQSNVVHSDCADSITGDDATSKLVSLKLCLRQMKSIAQFLLFFLQLRLFSDCALFVMGSIYGHRFWRFICQEKEYQCRMSLYAGVVYPVQKITITSWHPWLCCNKGHKYVTFAAEYNLKGIQSCTLCVWSVWDTIMNALCLIRWITEIITNSQSHSPDLEIS